MCVFADKYEVQNVAIADNINFGENDGKTPLETAPPSDLEVVLTSL
jgi:hypothetical protein